MEFLEKNLKALETHSKEIYDAVIEELDKDDIVSELEIESIKTRDDNLALTVKKDGKLYRFNSIYSPLRESDIWADQYEIKNIKTVISMIGLGNGFFARSIIKRLDNGASVILYEPSVEIFIHVLKNYDISDIISEYHVTLVLKGVNEKKIIPIYNKMVNWLNFANQKFCVHPKYDEVFVEECEKFLQTFIEIAQRAQIERNTEFYFANSTLNNFLYNMRYIKEGQILSQYKNTFPEETPAIIVSAGPSLDKNIDELKMAKGKAVIFCVDTAIKYLLKKDIVPDFLVTVDAKKRMEYFEDPRSWEIPIICKYESNCEILKNSNSKKIFYGSEEYMEGLYSCVNKETMPVYDAGGSVATCTFSVLRDLGFKKIILVGQDLAYNGDISHAGGDIFKINEEEIGLSMVEGIDGKMVKTRYDWLCFLRWFETAIVLNPDIKVIDATEGGAKIAGSKIMKLKDAINEYCKIDIDCEKIVNEKPAALNEEEMNTVKNYIESLDVELDIIKRKSEKTIGSCDKLLKYCQNHKKEDTNYFKLANQIKKANFFVEAKPIYKMIDLYLSDKVMLDMMNIFEVNEDEFADKAKTYNDIKMVYKQVIIAAGELKKSLKKVKESL